MDPILDAIRKDNLAAFLDLTTENEDVLEHTVDDYLNTALHIAAKLGHLDIAERIVMVCPEMVAAENKEGDTPLHEACRGSNSDVVKLLLAAGSLAASKVNGNGESPLFAACSSGHLDAVNLLIKLPGILDSDELGHDHKTRSIHEASSKGHTDVVRELLNASPCLAQKADERGNTALHYAASGGHREIAWTLLRRDPNLALGYNNNGYTPLHLAAVQGGAWVLEEFTRMAPAAFHYLTKEEESVFHLAVRYGHFEAFVFLLHCCSGTNLLHCQDRYGNTVLHLAVSRRRFQIAEFLISKTKVETNTRNSKGQTALDVLDQTKGRTGETRNIENLLVRAGGERATETATFSPEALSSRLSYVFESDTSVNEIAQSPPPPKKPSQLRDKIADEIYINLRGKTTSNVTPAASDSLRARRRRKSTQSEAVQNARNTIVLVAILIATVAFTAGMSPPGGVHQEGPMVGKATAGRTTAFKVFMIANNAALFVSLSIVVVLVSIIPFRRKAQMRLLGAAHKAMWVAVGCMATGFVAATRVVVPRGGGGKDVLAVVVAVSSTTLGVVFVGLMVLLVEHWLRKWKWQRLMRRWGLVDGDDTESLNSDVESSYRQGYHSY